MKKNAKLQNPEEVMQQSRELLKSWIRSENQPETNRLDVSIQAADIKECVKALIENHWGYLSAITALDLAEFKTVEGSTEKKAIPGKGHIDLLYHFCAGPVITSLRVSLPYDKAEIESIYEVLPSATLYEREASELLGVDFIGATNKDHLLLPDDWPAGVFPLRKTFTGLEKKQKVKAKER